MKFIHYTVAKISRPLGLVIALLLCSVAASNAWADPPGRVGRVSEVTGQVWLYSPDAGEWMAAQRNRPLTTGDRLSTDASGRVEVHIGSTTVRLGSGSEVEVKAIDDEHVSLQLHSGRMSARLRDHDSVREFEVTTADGKFQTQRTGSYRFDRVDEKSEVTVWSGQALYEGPGSALTVYSGQRAEFWLDSNNSAQYSITEPVRDAFAAWTRERDRSDDRTASTRYVSPEMTGVEDLDRYGRWERDPDYGQVWFPSAVAVGWAPYSAGHWAFVSPWGWTWVDDAPWGFAPFHYGRWANVRNRWCWVPGTYVRRPVYAPALVAWVGGPHLSVSVSVGGGPAPAVGWLPLAPREVYVPSYRVSPNYVRQVNVTHVTNITNVTTIVNNPQTVVNQNDYRNRRFPHAVTVVPQSVMVNRQAVAPAAAQLREAPVVRELANKPIHQMAVAAPPVAAPPAAQRRLQAQQQRGEPARPGAAPAAALVVPPSPLHIANPKSDATAPPEGRRRDAREDTRQPPVVAPNVARPNATPPATQGAPAQPAPAAQGAQQPHPSPQAPVGVPARPGAALPAAQGTPAQPPAAVRGAHGQPPPAATPPAATAPPPQPAAPQRPAPAGAKPVPPRPSPPVDGSANERRGRPSDVRPPDQRGRPPQADGVRVQPAAPSRPPQAPPVEPAQHLNVQQAGKAAAAARENARAEEQRKRGDVPRSERQKAN